MKRSEKKMRKADDLNKNKRFDSPNKQGGKRAKRRRKEKKQRKEGEEVCQWELLMRIFFKTLVCLLLLFYNQN